MKSNAQTIEEYLNALPLERREAIGTVRKVILDNLPDGYEEVMNWGMITYQVPMATFPDTYNGKALMYAALAKQKNHMAIYLCSIYCSQGMKKNFKQAFISTGRKLNMGASCVRFKKLQDLPLDLVGKTIASVDVQTFINTTKSAHQKRKGC